MTERRLITLFCTLLGLFVLCEVRLFLVAQNSQYAQSAQQQTVTTVSLALRRGNLLDAEGTPLTGYTPGYYALCIPGENSYAELFRYTDTAGQRLLYQNRNAVTPFLLPVTQDLTALGIYTYEVPQRYLPTPIACHLLGYVDGEGTGVAGLELALEEVLAGSGVADSVQCITTAQGGLMQQTAPVLLRAQNEPKNVRTTLSVPVQRLCEGIAADTMQSGCILVLEGADARVRASVSLPEFDPDNLQSSIEAGDTSLLNRAFCRFNVGSVFKPVLAAAALENNLGWFGCNCAGAVEVDGHTYRCAKGIAHGELNLRGALLQSCNCYFIELGQALGGAKTLEMAKKLGFGSATYLAGGLKSAEGNLPTLETLQNTGQLAGFSFGQGQLLATPLQVAACMNTIAQGGVYTSPSFLEAVVDPQTGREVKNLRQAQSWRAMRPSTAKTLREYCCGVVEEGIGREAQPLGGGAGGKTGTAQTGVVDEGGDEQLNFWFAGFYPAEEPRYTVVVLQDSVAEPVHSSAAIFARVCDGLALLDDTLVPAPSPTPVP